MKTFNPGLVRVALMLKFLWRFLGLFLSSRSYSPKLPPKTILVFDFHLIGDIVLLTPLLQVLRGAYPDARIVLVAGPWAQELLCGEEFVDEIIPFSAPWVKYRQGWRGWLITWRLLRRLRRESWDMGIEIRGDVRQILLLAWAGAKCRVGFNFTGGSALLTDVILDDGHFVHVTVHHQRIAEYLGIWPVNKEYLPFLRLTDEEIKQAKDIPAYVGIHLGASLLLRKFFTEEAVNLIKEVAESTGFPIILFSGPGDIEYTKKLINAFDVSLTKRLQIWEGPLRAFMVMASRADRFFCMDSGPAHIVAALGIPVTVFFGPNRPEYVMPLGKNIQIVENKEIACRPCDQVNCTNNVEKACLSGLARKWRIV